MAITIRRIVVFAMILALTAGSFGFSGVAMAEVDEGVREEILKLQDNIKSKKEEVAKLEEKIGTMKKSIERKRVEALSLKNQMSVLDQHLEAVHLDVESTKLEIETVQLELQEMHLAIKEKEEQIGKQKTIISELLRTLHRESDRNYVELLLSEDSFSEFFSQVQYLEEVNKDIGQQVQALRNAKAELEEKESNLAEKEKSLEEFREALAAKEQDLEGQKGYKEKLFEETKENEATFQGMLADLRKQYQQIETEIQSIEKQIRTKLEGNDKLQQEGDVVLSWPTPSHYITAYFHDPDY